jgi:hypothetical protein
MDSTSIIAIIVMLVVVNVIVVVVYTAVQTTKKREQAKNDELKERLLIQARNFAADVQKDRALRTVATNIILKPGEAAFYSKPSTLFETRAIRHYQAGHVGFRVARGVWVGGTSGRSTSTQEWDKIDTGTLTITNRRLIFDGRQQDRTVPLDKIVSVNCAVTWIEVSVEGRQKSMILAVDNPMIAAAIIQLCRQAKDPLNLSEKIDLQFE